MRLGNRPAGTPCDDPRAAACQPGNPPTLDITGAAKVAVSDATCKSEQISYHMFTEGGDAPPA
jgi:hypothetical protein